MDVKTTVPAVARKNKRRRRKGKAKAQPHKDTLEATVTHHTEEKTCSAASVTPVNAHQSVVVNHAAESAATAHQPKSAPVDLTTCDSVSYEMRDCIPGVKYMKNGTQDWTPVVKRSRRRKKSDYVPSGSCNSSSSDTSESELDVSCSRKVEYDVREGIPGVTIYRRNVVWKPVMPSPVSSRTRSRTNK